jgi:hypothetical protein
MSELMYHENFVNITNIDISDVVIEKMKELYKDNCEKMQCKNFYFKKYFKKFKTLFQS